MIVSKMIFYVENIMNAVVIVIFTGVLVALVFLFRRFLPKLTKQKDTREEAIRLGLSVSEITEGAPTFSSDVERMNLSGQGYVKYTLSKPTSKAPVWSFLQRIEDKNVHYPKNWQLIEGVRKPEIWFLVVETGNVNQLLKETLKQIAGEWTEEYLEFESTPTQINAYWAEWGGTEQAKVLYKYLKAIIDAETV